MSPSELFESLPADRRSDLEIVRKTILAYLPAGYVESVGSGMLLYEVPLSVHPNTYNKKPLMYAALASQKNYMALHLCSAYALPSVQEELVAGFAAAKKKLDMGKSCIRFKSAADLPLPVIGKAIAAIPMDKYVLHDRMIHSEEGREQRRKDRAKAKK